MSLVDNDLLSVQEARILLENLEGSEEVLEGLPVTLIDEFLNQVCERLLPVTHDYAEMAFRESDYGNVEDEDALTRWVLTDLFADVRSQPPVHELRRNPETGAVEVGMSKGVTLSLLPDWIAVPTLLSQLAMAAWSRSPVVFSARTRVHETCARVMRDVWEVAQDCHYPTEALGFLCTYDREGEAWLSRQDGVRVVVDARECERIELAPARGKDLYYATVGNNPVFVEATADLALCAREVVAGASFCYGMLPGAEQSVVAEASVDGPLRRALAAEGAHFLTDEEGSRLITTLLRPDGRAYRELIAKSAADLARRAGISVPEGTKVLVVERPYVSEQSLYTRAKYGPVLSYYVEENWRGACEKCIELILGSGHGNALSIFSQDPEVVRQFILKKPVGRILVNASSGLGSIGCHAELPKTLTVTGWDLATTSGLGLTYQDLVRKRQVGCADIGRDRALLEAAGLVAAKPSRGEPARPGTWFSDLLASVS